MLAYRLKNRFQHWIRRPWLRRCRRFLKRLPYAIVLACARALQWMMFSPIFKGPIAALVLRSNRLWQTMFTNTR